MKISEILGKRKEIKQKREKFYNSIKEITFSSTSKDKESLLEIIQKNCKALCTAIDERIKNHKGKSESNKYLEAIRTRASVINDIRIGDKENLYKIFWPNLILLLEALKEACAEAGNARFKKTTFGAVLEYKPTLEKFTSMSKEIGKLIKDYLEIEQKRKEFYDSLAEITFKFSSETLKNGAELVSAIEGSCTKLYDAISVSEKDEYLKSIKSAARITESAGKIKSEDEHLKNLGEILKDVQSRNKTRIKKDVKVKSKTTIDLLKPKLIKLKDECKKAGEAKFIDISPESALRYKLTLEKFQNLAKQLDDLIKSIN